jgi:hypothetical protein
MSWWLQYCTNLMFGSAHQVYRGLGNLILLLVCWGMDLRVWQNYGIDYERFLRMPPAQPGTDRAAQVCV